MRARILSACVAALVLAGCLNGAPPDAAPKTAASGPAGEARQSATHDESGGQANIRLVASGDGGSAAFSFVAFDNATTSVEWAVTGWVRVAGTGDAFLLPPQALPIRLDGDGVFFHEQPVLAVNQMDFSWAADQPWETPAAGLGGNDHVGFVFAFGSSAPWAVDILVDRGGDRTQTAPVVEVAFEMQAEPTRPGGPNFGYQITSADVGAPGWIHYEVQREPGMARGVRYVDYEFPDGLTCRDPQVEYGAGPGPLASGTTSRLNYAGSFRSPAGQFSARLAHAGEAEVTRTAFAYLGIAQGDLPDVFQDHYAGPRPGNIAFRTGCA